jgi:hypothetical protein
MALHVFAGYSAVENIEGRKQRGGPGGCPKRSVSWFL